MDEKLELTFEGKCFAEFLRIQYPQIELPEQKLVINKSDVSEEKP
jgi:hypothetical protein